MTKIAWKKICSKAAFIMYTAGGGGRWEGAKDIFERAKVFHIPSHHAEFFDIPPLDQKKREERSSIFDVKQRSFLKRFAASLMGICMWSLLIIQPCSTCSYSDCSITACKANKPNITDHFHSFLAAKVDLPLVNIEAEELIITLKALKERKVG